MAVKVILLHYATCIATAKSVSLQLHKEERYTMRVVVQVASQHVRQVATQVA